MCVHIELHYFCCYWDEIGYG